ncbi:MAG TPA: AI-2E family transporter [Steroidobacteraceae bacterium]|nr:AI-2E family transporter [Steroidobacteraceae bacterium]
MPDYGSALSLRRLLMAALLAGLLLLGFLVLDPFIVPVVWAAILGYVTWPGYEWLRRKCGGGNVLAALAMTAVVSAAVIVPLAWLAVVVRLELVHAYSETQRLLAGGELPPALLKLPWVGDQLRDLAARVAQDPQALGAALRKLADHSFDQIAHLAGGVGRNAAKLLLTVVSLFFVYRDGAAVAAQLARALEHMVGPRVHSYLQSIGQTVKAVIYGLVLAAVVQGLLVGIGYWLAGVGAPVFLAALTTVCGLIPFAAPAIWVCVTAWLLLEGNTVAGIGLLVWGGVVMGWTDHIVRPFLISREAEIPFLVVLFGVLGGLAAFGLVGLFVGPVILAVLLAIWREWQHESLGSSEKIA